MPVPTRARLRPMGEMLAALRTLGVDHEKLTYKTQGRDFRLTDVHGHVVKEVLA